MFNSHILMQNQITHVHSLKKVGYIRFIKFLNLLKALYFVPMHNSCGIRILYPIFLYTILSDVKLYYINIKLYKIMLYHSERPYFVLKDLKCNFLGHITRLRELSKIFLN